MKESDAVLLPRLLRDARNHLAQQQQQQHRD
jgi:hypothetical protein